MILLLILTLEHKDLENWNNNNFYCFLLIFSQQWGLHSCTSKGLKKDQRDLGWNGCGHTQEPFWEAAVPVHSSRHPFCWTDWLKSESCLAHVVFPIHIEQWSLFWRYDSQYCVHDYPKLSKKIYPTLQYCHMVHIGETKHPSK